MWKLLLGNPWTIAAVTVGLLATLAGSFAFGFYTATGQYEAALLNQQETIAKSQHDLDVANAAKARAVSQLATERHKKAETTIVTVQQEIEKLPEIVSGPACDISTDVLKLLNEAGK